MVSYPRSAVIAAATDGLALTDDAPELALGDEVVELLLDELLQPAASARAAAQNATAPALALAIDCLAMYLPFLGSASLTR
jgi:hypothetical protein